MLGPACSDLSEGLRSWLFSLECLKKPVGELLVHAGETYRRVQEERELIDRMLPTQHDGKARTVFPSALRGGGLDTGMAASVCTTGDKTNLPIAKHC